MGKWIEFRGTKLFVYRQQEDFLFACETVEEEQYYFWVNEKNKNCSLIWNGIPVIYLDERMEPEEPQEVKDRREELQKKSILWSMWEDRAFDFFKGLYSVMAAALPKNE